MLNSKILRHSYKLIVFCCIFYLIKFIPLGEAFNCKESIGVIEILCYIVGALAAVYFLFIFLLLPNVSLFLTTTDLLLFFNSILEFLFLMFQIIISFSLIYIISKKYNIPYKFQLLLAYILYIFFALTYSIYINPRGL